MKEDIKQLAMDAIKQVLLEELSYHCQEGSGDYRMSNEAIDLVRRARAMGLGPLEPYEGYDYLSQADRPTTTTPLGGGK